MEVSHDKFLRQCRRSVADGSQRRVRGRSLFRHIGIRAVMLSNEADTQRW